MNAVITNQIRHSHNAPQGRLANWHKRTKEVTKQVPAIQPDIQDDLDIDLNDLDDNEVDYEHEQDLSTDRDYVEIKKQCRCTLV